MKRLITLVLALMLLISIPSIALADDPPDTDVDIGISSPGDVNVGVDIDAGGSVGIDVGDNSDVSVNGDGLATAEGLSNLSSSIPRAGGDDGIHSMWVNNNIHALWEHLQEMNEVVGNHLVHDMRMVVTALAKDIVVTRSQGEAMDNMARHQDTQDWWISQHGEQIAYDRVQIACGVEYDAWQDAQLSSLTDATNANNELLHQRLVQVEDELASTVALTRVLTIIIICFGFGLVALGATWLTKRVRT